VSVRCKLYLDILNRFDVVHECDRQLDGNAMAIAALNAHFRTNVRLMKCCVVMH